MQESNDPLITTPSNQWETTWYSIANSRLWLFLLMAFSVENIVTNPRPALAAFEAIAGTTLTPRKAFLAAIMIWLVSLLQQFYDYGHSYYGHSHRSAGALFFGVALVGLELLVVTSLGAIRPTFSRITRKGHYIWMVIAIVVAFVLAEIVVVLLFLRFWPGLILGGESLTWASVGFILAFSLPKTSVSYLIFIPTLTLIHFFFTRFTVRSIE